MLFRSMATAFWYSHGIILIDYLQKGKTITGAYYASLLDKLKAGLAEKRPHLQKKKIPIHQDLREQLFCGEKRRILFGRITEMEASLGEVYSVTRRLC